MFSSVTGMPFTDDEAWHLVADLLDAEHPVEVIEMNDKPGTHGFVILVDLVGSDRQLYIKVQLGAGIAIGRSFHWSTIER